MQPSSVTQHEKMCGPDGRNNIQQSTVTE